MTQRRRPLYPTPVERLSALRGQLEDLRRAGTGGNVTLDILVELTEIVASLAILERSAQVSA